MVNQMALSTLLDDFKMTSHRAIVALMGMSDTAGDAALLQAANGLLCLKLQYYIYHFRTR